MSSGDDEDPGTRVEERRFSVVPGEPDDGDRWPEEPDPSHVGAGAAEEGTPSEESTDDESPESTSNATEVKTLFWTLVAVVDVAILAIALGLMFVGFEGDWSLGGQLLLLGVVLLGFGWYRYWSYRRSEDESDVA